MEEKDILLKVSNNEISKEEAMIELKKLYAKKNNNSVDNTQVEKNIENIICEIIQNKLHISIDEIDCNMSFNDMGVDSISGVEIITEINEKLKLNLDKVILYEQTNIKKLSHYISDLETNIIIEKDISKEMNITEESYDVKEDLSIKPNTNSLKKGIEFEEIKDKILDIISNLLHYPKEEIDSFISFKELGIDSISGVEIVNSINKELKLNLDKVVLYDYPNINLLTQYIIEEFNKNLETNKILKDINGETKNISIDDSVKEDEIKKNVKDNFTSISSKINFNQAQNSIITKEGKIKLCNIDDINNNFVWQRDIPKVKLKEVSFKENIATINKNQEIPKPKEKISNVENKIKNKVNYTNEDIAVIGISGRFPGANNVREFWKNIKNGVCSVDKIPESRWNIENYFDERPRTFGKTYCKYGGYLDDIDKFDPLFFSISPREAEFMDPQQRIFLEESWKAIEDAGYTTNMLDSEKCGVFVGATYSDYGNLISKSGLNCTSDAFTGLAPSILASRISYYLNLTGPSLTIDTACSSSLVAISEACKSIISKESNIALAGGIMLMLTPDLLIKTSDSGMVSASGKCSTFDNSADGTVFSEGVGVVLLKPLEKAIEDNDYIYGVIKGSLINQDGKTNGITAPSLSSQANLEEELYRNIGINPESISYIEAHGTGTKLGDPIEIKALTKAFRKFTDKNGFCGIGSVKSNIGHTTMASGVISLIKVLLSMKYNLIPPSINYSVPNEHINFEDTPFYVVSKSKEWKHEENKLRRAAISSFGFSGTNCHMIVDEYIEN